MKASSKYLLAATVCALALVALPAQAEIFTNSTFGTFDLSSGTRTFSVGGVGTVNDVDITIQFAKCDNPAQTVFSANCTGGTAGGTSNNFGGETVFRLTSPGGIVVNLVNAGTYINQLPGHGITVHFDQEAGSVVGGTMVSGDFRPVGNLDLLDGEIGDGTWTLFIQDTVGLDPLSFFRADLQINGPGGVASVPEPASLALLGVALGAFGLSRRRKTI